MKSKILCLLLIILCFVSCQNGAFIQNTDKNQEQKQEQNNTEILLSVQVDSSAVYGRTASVVVPENVNYVVEATKGTAIFQASSPDEDNYYLLGLNEDGEWKVSVKGYNGRNQIFTGENTVKVSGNGKYFVTVNVYFIEDTGVGNGSVNLSMDVSATSISKLVIYDADNLNGTYTSQSGNISINKSEIKPGAYNALFAFYDSDNALIVRFRESIVIKSNMTTNKWIKSKASVYLVENEESGETAFVLTPEIILNITASQFYVNSSGSDSGSGNFSSPFATLQSAVNRCFALNDIDAQNNVFTIYVDGQIGNDNTSTVIDQDKYKNPIVLTIIGNSDDAKIGGNVTVTNCDLMLESVKVGGKLVLSGTPITLSGSTKITGALQFNSENLFIKAQNLSESRVAIITFKTSIVQTYTRNYEIIKGVDSKLTIDEIRKFLVINNDYVLSYDSVNKTGVLQYSEGTIFDLPLYKLTMQLSKSEFVIDAKKEDISMDVFVTVSDYPSGYEPAVVDVDFQLYNGSTEIAIKKGELSATENEYEWKKSVQVEDINSGIYKLLITVNTDSGVYSTSKIIKVEEA